MRAENCRQPLRFGAGCTFYGEVIFGENTILGDHVVIGYPKEMRLEEFQHSHDRAVPSDTSPFDAVKSTKIGANCLIASHIVIYEGTQVGDNVSIDDCCRIGFDCIVGSNTRLQYAVFVCDRVRIGSNCVVAGFVCDGSVIGNHAKVMGTLVHEFTRPHLPWGLIESSPKIEDRAVVGFGATVVGGVTIGHNSYVVAGAVVTKDIPPKSIVVGVNQVIPWNNWHGKKLSREFWLWREEGQ